MTVLAGVALAVAVLVLRARFARRRRSVVVQLDTPSPYFGVDPREGIVHGGF